MAYGLNNVGNVRNSNRRVIDKSIGLQAWVISIDCGHNLMSYRSCRATEISKDARSLFTHGWYEAGCEDDCRRRWFSRPRTRLGPSVSRVQMSVGGCRKLLMSREIDEDDLCTNQILYHSHRWLTLVCRKSPLYSRVQVEYEYLVIWWYVIGIIKPTAFVHVALPRFLCPKKTTNCVHYSPVRGLSLFNKFTSTTRLTADKMPEDWRVP